MFYWLICIYYYNLFKKHYTIYKKKKSNHFLFYLKMSHLLNDFYDIINFLFCIFLHIGSTKWLRDFATF